MYDYPNIEGITVHNVDFGLDPYYVPENTGEGLEDLSAKGQLVAHLKVNNGYGILKDIQAVQ